MQSRLFQTLLVFSAVMTARSPLHAFTIVNDTGFVIQATGKSGNFRLSELIQETQGNNTYSNNAINESIEVKIYVCAQRTNPNLCNEIGISASCTIAPGGTQTVTYPNEEVKVVCTPPSSK